MLNNSKLITFLPTSKPEEAKIFYRDIIGLELLADDRFALVFDGNGIMLRIAKVEGLTPTPYTVLGWIVNDIKIVIEDLIGKGVQFKRYGGFEQDELGICSFPNGDQVAWFQDPDGNTLSLTQFPEQQHA